MCLVFIWITFLHCPYATGKYWAVRIFVTLQQHGINLLKTQINGVLSEKSRTKAKLPFTRRANSAKLKIHRVNSIGEGSTFHIISYVATMFGFSILSCAFDFDQLEKSGRTNTYVYMLTVKMCEIKCLRRESFRNEDDMMSENRTSLCWVGKKDHVLGFTLNIRRLMKRFYFRNS